MSENKKEMKFATEKVNSVTEQIMQEMAEKQREEQEGLFREGLKRKGFEFECHRDMINFVMYNCSSSEKNDGSVIFSVRGEPFLYYRQNREGGVITKFDADNLATEIITGWYYFI
jgi:hypothetical protein